MNVVEPRGIVRDVINVINYAYAGDQGGVNRVPIVSRVELTRAEMDEFIAGNPFTGKVGKFYGDDYLSSLLNIEYHKGTDKVLSFVIEGILFTVI